MCRICEGKQDLLGGSMEVFNDVYLFGLKKEENMKVETILEAFEKEDIRVFCDRGHIRLTKGDDINCLEHSLDYVKINFCPMCGLKL